MGVCHTVKVVHVNNKEQTREQILVSNQDTYKPCKVFSAGPVELIEELEDGRMLIEVDHNVRLELASERQTLPFTIWDCEELPDRTLSDAEMQELQQSKEKLLKRLLSITHEVEEAQQALNDDFWQKMSALRFSFAVTSLMGTDAGVKQQLLEMTDPNKRLTTVLALLNTIR